jgi:DNA ligase-1
MPDLRDGESVEVQGSARSPYLVRNVGGVFSCSCPAWRNQSLPIERRTCKHIRFARGDAAEATRLRQTLSAPVLTTATIKPPPLLLAHTWGNDTDLTGWWLSEKLDGVRAYWTGQQFLSRQGNEYHAPTWFTDHLPNVPLDGELWLARKAFQRTVSIVRRHDATDLWREIKFVVFDAPAVSEPFEGRQEFLRRALGDPKLRYAQWLAQERCGDVAQLRAELARITALGGEGLMLRQPGSRYEVGRSSTLLKLKTMAETDACVIEHLAGQGRHRGRMGALLVRLANGTTFNVGTGFIDAERESPPKVGCIITVRYQELTDRGVPRFPSFVRVRRDVTSLVPE